MKNDPRPEKGQRAKAIDAGGSTNGKQWKKGISSSAIRSLMAIRWDHSHISQVLEVQAAPHHTTPLLSLPASAEDKMHHCAPKTVIRAGVWVGAAAQKQKFIFHLEKRHKYFDTGISEGIVIT